MTKFYNDRVQSFHMQSQRSILGVKWYDKIINAAIKLMALPSSPIDGCTHFLVTSADYPGVHTFHKHFIYPLMPSPASLVPVNLQPWTARYGHRYRTLKRGSE